MARIIERRSVRAMRSFIMKSLVATMAGAAVLAFGVAKAGEGPDPDTPRLEAHHALDAHYELSVPAGYRVVELDAHIRAGTPIAGFQVVNDRQVLIQSGDGPFLADLLGTCAQGGSATMAVALDPAPGGDVDRFSQVIIDGRRCGLRSLTKLERVHSEASR
jgi:hypothetical protein